MHSWITSCDRWQPRPHLGISDCTDKWYPQLRWCNKILVSTIFCCGRFCLVGCSWRVDLTPGIQAGFGPSGGYFMGYLYCRLLYSILWDTKFWLKCSRGKHARLQKLVMCLWASSGRKQSHSSNMCCTTWYVAYDSGQISRFSRRIGFPIGRFIRFGLSGFVGGVCRYGAALLAGWPDDTRLVVDSQ